MKKKLPYYLEIAARVFVFVSISVYGWAKLTGFQFYRQGHLPEQVRLKTLESLTGFDIAWTFFGYSYTYILFIGISQVIGATFLLFNRTKILGAFILIPILLNIIVVDIFFEIQTGAMLNACFYFLMTLLILWFNRETIFQALKILSSKGDADSRSLILTDVLWIGGLVILIFALGTVFIWAISYLLTLIK